LGFVQNGSREMPVEDDDREGLRNSTIPSVTL